MNFNTIFMILFTLSCVFTFENTLDTRNNKKIQNRIVGIHNYFRSMVRPTASNMLAMFWSSEAAQLAQNHADSCQFGTHSTSEQRKSKKFYMCGESLSIYGLRHPEADWFHAIQLWYDEKSLYTYGGDLEWIKQNFEEIGHYTALMWATTSHVGCGYARCMNDTTNKQKNFAFHNFVCSYCPIGNDQDYLNKPYRRGKSCGDCPNNCFQNALCLNACPVYNHYGPKYCDKDNGKFFKWYQSGCRDKNVIEHCAATCVCGGKNKIYW